MVVKDLLLADNRKKIPRKNKLLGIIGAQLFTDCMPFLSPSEAMCSKYQKNCFYQSSKCKKLSCEQSFLLLYKNHFNLTELIRLHVQLTVWRWRARKTVLYFIHMVCVKSTAWEFNVHNIEQQLPDNIDFTVGIEKHEDVAGCSVSTGEPSADQTEPFSWSHNLHNVVWPHLLYRLLELGTHISCHTIWSMLQLSHYEGSEAQRIIFTQLMVNTSKNCGTQENYQHATQISPFQS